MKTYDFTKQDRENELIEAINNLTIAMMSLALAFQPVEGRA